MATSVRVSFHNVTWKSQAHFSIPGLIRHDPYINLLCSFTPSANDTLLYHIDWYVDNDIVIQGQTVDKYSLQDAILSAEDMNKAGKKINSWVGIPGNLTNLVIFHLSHWNYIAKKLLSVKYWFLVFDYLMIICTSHIFLNINFKCILFEIL